MCLNSVNWLFINGNGQNYSFINGNRRTRTRVAYLRLHACCLLLMANVEWERVKFHNSICQYVYRNSYHLLGPCIDACIHKHEFRDLYQQATSENRRRRPVWQVATGGALLVLSLLAIAWRNQQHSNHKYRNNTPIIISGRNTSPCLVVGIWIFGATVARSFLFDK